MKHVEALQPKIKELAEKHGLSLVVLFGSQATGATHPKSDIDIAVLSSKSFDRNKLLNDIGDIFKRDDVEIVNMAEASPTMMYVLIRDGKLLYEDGLGAFLKWKFYAIRVWLDTAWLRRLRDRKMIEWAKTA
jgi:predicted nucleotidyltransferase